jgi:hypothetical protein
MHVILTRIPYSIFVVIRTAEDGYVRRNAIFCSRGNVELFLHLSNTPRWFIGNITQFDVGTMYIAKNCSAMPPSLPPINLFLYNCWIGDAVGLTTVLVEARFSKCHCPQRK